MDRRKLYIAEMAVLGLVLALYPLVETNSQEVTIEGRVVLERVSSSPERPGFDGYQTMSSSASETTDDSASREILIWLEAVDRDASYLSSESTVPVLDQVDKQFKPRLLGIRVGEKVRIKNSDPIYHNVFSLSRTRRFDVGRRPPGDHEDVSFDQPGIVDVFCDIHSDMHAVIVVMPKQTVDWQNLNGSGTFRFENIPQGNYKLHFYATGDRRRSIDIRAVDMKKVTLETIRLGS